MSSILCSIVEYYSEQKDYRCGYCKNPNGNISHGMWAHRLTVQDYQNLIDRGWRRSGCYCYKPTMDKICCPAYTIRCDALHFKISKSQKKILKRMSNFLKNKVNKEDKMSISSTNIMHSNELAEIPKYEEYAKKAAINFHKMNVSFVSCGVNKNLLEAESNLKSCCTKNTKIKDSIASSSTSEHFSLKDAEKKEDQFTDMHNNKTPLKKAKLLRLEKKQNKLLSQGKSFSEIETILAERKQQNCSKSLEDFFSGFNSETNKLEMKLVRTAPISSEYISTESKSFQLFKKYQMKVHGDEDVSMKKYTRFLVKSPLQLKLIRVMSDEFLKTFDESANLYKKYQMAIHKDEPEECDKLSFFNFLVKSPLQEWCPENGPSQGYGSFHDQYWLNGQLIAVGVIDILPSCISSVYFFYDPAYSHLSLGTFSSLREIFLTRQLSKTIPNLKYYYMGFYIHLCPKMRYKSKMIPSNLLCPETYKWCDIEKSLLKLEVNKYSRLNENLDQVDEDSIIKIDEVLVLFREEAMLYGMYKRKFPASKDVDEVRDYAVHVGMKCAKSILLCRNSS